MRVTCYLERNSVGSFIQNLQIVYQPVVGNMKFPDLVANYGCGRGNILVVRHAFWQIIGNIRLRKRVSSSNERKANQDYNFF